MPVVSCSDLKDQSQQWFHQGLHTHLHLDRYKDHHWLNQARLLHRPDPDLIRKILDN